MSNHYFGIYDIILGYYARISSQIVIKEIDLLNSKVNPDKVIGEDIGKIFSLTSYTNNVITKLENFKTVSSYYHKSNCTRRLHKIKVPLFFLSALDDPIMGSEIIPFDKCYENILIGVTKAGGHIGYFEGFILPKGQWFPQPSFEFINYFRSKS
jgi:predicted alpha/beta-fold hydrolase